MAKKKNVDDRCTKCIDFSDNSNQKQIQADLIVDTDIAALVTFWSRSLSFFADHAQEKQYDHNEYNLASS